MLRTQQCKEGVMKYQIILVDDFKYDDNAAVQTLHVQLETELSNRGIGVETKFVHAYPGFDDPKVIYKIMGLVIRAEQKKIRTLALVLDVFDRKGVAGGLYIGKVLRNKARMRHNPRLFNEVIKELGLNARDWTSLDAPADFVTKAQAVLKAAAVIHFSTKYVDPSKWHATWLSRATTTPEQFVDEILKCCSTK
jgi:hypothetical protein